MPPRERGPHIDDGLREADVVPVSIDPPPERQIAKNVDQITRMALQIRELRVPVRSVPRHGRVARRPRIVVHVRAAEDVAVNGRGNGVVRGGVGGGVVDAAEHCVVACADGDVVDGAGGAEGVRV